MNENNQIGSVVYSRAGRDAGKCFIIIGIINEEYVYISDGDLRTIEKPKKKKIKHLIPTHMIAEEIKSLLLSGNKIDNNKINRFLQSVDISKEV